jgi:hypothetical protein
VPGKGLWGTSAVSSKPSEGSVPKLLPSCLARCCPRDPEHLLVGSAQALSPRGCSPGWAYRSPSLNVTGRICLVGWFSGRLRSLVVYPSCLASKRLSAGSRAASRIRGPIGVALKAPVIALACWLTSCCKPFSLSFWPRHHSSAPYRATACTAAFWILLILLSIISLYIIRGS